MKNIKTYFVIILLCICPFLYAQKNIGGKPYSFDKEFNVKNVKRNTYPEVELAKLDMQKIVAEDKINDSTLQPFRYGIAVEVDLNLDNSGEWLTLEDGNRIWRLRIHCPEAKSIHFTYDKFWIPTGGVLYICDNNKTTYIGGFNEENNQGIKEKPSKYVTGLIFSDVVVLEYFEPKEVMHESIISISNVIYGYRDMPDENNLRGFGDAPCSVNINCSPEGDDWQQEKTSVAKILMSGWLCSGSLINNTRYDGTPYFLTACHCMDSNNCRDENNLDADASYFIFYWDYESSECVNGVNFTPPSTAGAIIKANGALSDFALLELKETPYELKPQVRAYFNGWDRRVPLGKTVGIHHPKGDIKKISIDNDSPYTVNNNLWWVHWSSLPNGNSILYGGSSGSPLYNNEKKVIGQAYAIAGENCSSQSAFYGRFDVSWNSNGSAPERKLSTWLDPDSTNVMFLDGTFCQPRNIIGKTINANTTIKSCGDINVQDVEVQSGKLTLDAAGTTKIISNFKVDLGAQLEIK